MSTLDGDEYDQFNEGPMDMEMRSKGSITKYADITPQSEASRLKAKQRKPSKLSTQVIGCADGCNQECSIF